jgi:DNA-directed RNA polymerase specialized sigma subunit
MSFGLEEPDKKIDYKTRDLNLYEQWNKDKSKKNMSILIKHLSPILTKEVSNISGSIPTAALQGEVKTWAVKAVKSFDPSRGFALSTHVINYIQRAKRLNYKFQNVARLPESMHLDFNKYNRALTQLSEELNQEPTTEHIAERLGWSKNKVERFKARIYSDYIESAEDLPSEVSAYSDKSILLKSLLSHLDETEKFILANKGNYSSTELADKLGINVNRLNYLIKKLTSKIQDLKQELNL